VERIPLDGWETYEGHLARYRWAAGKTKAGERAGDVACGIGYGATFFPHAVIYRGYDKPGVPWPHFPGQFYGSDIDDPGWSPEPCDVTCCFETLEHVADPAHLARVLMETTARSVFVSVPVIPTVHCNEFHRTDFTRGDIPLLFSGFAIEDEWAQPEETSHVWQFTRA
jgi:hypothetical protein